MRSHPARIAAGALMALALLSCTDSATTSPSRSANRDASPGSYPSIVISQVYGGGGNSGATLKNDFIELHNPGSTAVSVAGWSVQYASSSATATWSATALTGSIPAGGYYLVQEAPGTGGTTALPTPDASGTLAISASTGKVLVTSGATPLSGACPAAAVDEVTFGSAVGCTFNGGANNTGTLSNTTAAIRNGGGCAFTGDASKDFTVAAPAPRNSATPPQVCAVLAPTSVVTVTPTTASIAVAASQTFAAAEQDAQGNAMTTTFTWVSSDPTVATVDATGIVTGVKAGSATITATAADGSKSTASVTVVGLSDVVISQVYGGGGNSGAPYSNDFIELFNRGATDVDLSGWSVQYSSANGSSWQTTPLAGSIAAGGYILVQEAAGSGTPAALPTPDVTGSIAMGATGSKIILANVASAQTGACPVGATVADRVAFGSSNCNADWGAPAGATSNTTAGYRDNDGCVNTGNASADFQILAPLPRNSASGKKSCTQPIRGQSTATVTIDEIMGDPAAAESPSWGEWFEVHNYGTTAVDLSGWKIISSGTNQPDHTVTGSLVVPAGGYAVLGRGDDITRNGGVTLDYNYFTGNGNTIWLDDADYLMLVDAQGNRADSVAWTSMPHGVTKALRDADHRDPNVDGSAWGYSNSTFGDGDYGTPHGANTPLVDSPPFVSSNTISFSGRTASDIALPVGFEAQLFGTEVDAHGTTVSTSVAWTALTPSLATIDQNGVMHALAPGFARFRAMASDGVSKVTTLAMATPVASTTAQYGNNTEFGMPSAFDATNAYIVSRPEYTTSWNGPRGIPNWVAYDLNGTQIVSGQDRCNCFTFDPELTAHGFTPYTTADYTGAGAAAGFGIDRGHMTRSFDRTSGTLDNATTYYLSNVVPQAADLNEGPWAILEDTLGDIAQTGGKEVYIYVGPWGSQGTVKGEGKITIPTSTWKIALVVPRGTGVANVRDYRDVSVIAVNMPNISGIKTADWHQWITTIGAIEQLTGYQFLTNLPAKTRRILELGIQPPIAGVDGPYAAHEGDAISMSGAASVDPNGTVVSYAWNFGDGGSATGATVTHSYALAGAYSVQLIATDNDGLADTVTTTTAVSHILPATGYQNLVNMVTALRTSGAINKGNATSLLVQLNTSERQLDKGHPDVALTLLATFQLEVRTEERTDRLTADQGNALLFEAQRLSSAIRAAGVR